MTVSAAAGRSPAPALSELWQSLPEVAFEGQSLGGVQVLRLDRCHPLAGGNKWFKLRLPLERACAQGHQRLLSFGGPWSNHLHALAAFGASAGFATIGVVRGDATAEPTATLRDCAARGMTLVHLSRGDYRRRHEPAFQQALLDRHGPAALIPEGGDCADGARGCLPIGRAIATACPRGATVVLPAGTGTTLAGVAAALGPAYTLLGISALKGALDTAERVRRNLAALGGGAGADWRMVHDAHEGGFARVSAPLRDFQLWAEAALELPLDPVYTAKALFALWRMRSRGDIDHRRPVVVVHTGGLQGRRGYAWLAGEVG